MAQSPTSDSPTTLTSPASSRSQPQRRGTEWLGVALYVALLLCLEVIPIEACLLTYQASAVGALDGVFGPLWLIVATLLAFALARWLLSSRRIGWVTLATLVIGVVAIILFVALSPTAYGGTPGGLFSPNWLSQLQADVASDSARFNGLFAIAPFVVYLGWRGLSLGGSPPRIEVTLRRFTISLAVVMFACIAALLAPGVAQAPLQPALLALLALDVFAGLAAAALARRGAGVESAEGTETARWLLTAFATAALVIVVAFALGLIFSFRFAGALLVVFSPVGAAVNAALSWFTEGFAYLLWVVFVKTIGALLFKNAAFYISPPKSVSAGISKPKPRVIAPPPHGLIVAVTVIVAVVIAVLIVVLVYLAVRSVLRALNRETEPEVDEEREALDARKLLRRQASDWLAGWRRAPAPEVDPLDRNGVRWLYRETLRAGAASGAPRRNGETADEYSQRLAQRLRASGEQQSEGGLASLTTAYDDTRYGERDTPATPALIAAARRMTAALAKLRAG